MLQCARGRESRRGGSPTGGEQVATQSTFSRLSREELIELLRETEQAIQFVKDIVDLTYNVDTFDHARRLDAVAMHLHHASTEGFSQVIALLRIVEGGMVDEPPF